MGSGGNAEGQPATPYTKVRAAWTGPKCLSKVLHCVVWRWVSHSGGTLIHAYTHTHTHTFSIVPQPLGQRQRLRLNEFTCALCRAPFGESPFCSCILYELANRITYIYTHTHSILNIHKALKYYACATDALNSTLYRRCMEPIFIQDSEKMAGTSMLFWQLRRQSACLHDFVDQIN